MSFDGPALSFDDEGSILFDGEKIIVTVPVGHEVLDHLGTEEDIPFPVVYTHPSHHQDQRPSTHVPPAGSNPVFNKEKAREHVERARQTWESARNKESKPGSSETKVTTDTNKARDEISVQAIPPDIAEMQDDFGSNGSVDSVSWDRLHAYSNLDVIRVKQDIERRPLTYELCFKQTTSFQSACEFIYADPEDVGGVEVIRRAWRLCQGGGSGSSPDARIDTETGLATEALHVAWKKAHEVGDDAAVAEYRGLIETTYGVSFESVDGSESWDLLRVRMVHVGLDMAAMALGGVAREMGLDWDNATAFRRIIGDIDLILSNATHDKRALAEVVGRDITFYWNANANRITYPLPNLLLHELGHVFNANVGFGERDDPRSINRTDKHPDTWLGMGSPYPSLLAPEIEPNTSVVYDETWMKDVLPLYDILGLDKGDKLFRGVNLTENQILLLRQSWAKDDTNEITADAFLNWVFHRNTDGAIGFMDTDHDEGWQAFMNDNMPGWIWQSIAQNVMRTGDSTYISQIDGFPDVFGSGTVQAARGLNVRSSPMVKDGNWLTALGKDENLLILGRSEDGAWIATAKRGVLAWVSYGTDSDPNVILPEGVNLEDLPPYDDNATLNLDPLFRSGKTNI